MEQCNLCWDRVPKSDTLTGSAWGVTGTICKECVEYVGNDAFQESLVPTFSNTYKPMDDLDWSYYNDIWGTSITGVNSHAIYAPCHHHMVPFTFKGLDDNYIVYLTGSLALTHEPSVAHLPTVGVYLDGGWLADRLASNTSSELDMNQPTSLYIGWPDLGTVKPELLSEAIEWVLPYVHNKDSIIEIACLGGHGRTGTFLASLMVREGWTATNAMSYIHDEYCTKAVETKGQEDLIETYSKMLTGVPHEVNN
jgi:hypothetical protein